MGDPRAAYFAEAALHTTGAAGSAADLCGDAAMQHTRYTHSVHKLGRRRTAPPR